jgi:hypothetical protein
VAVTSGLPVNQRWARSFDGTAVQTRIRQRAQVCEYTLSFGSDRGGRLFTEKPIKGYISKPSSRRFSS